MALTSETGRLEELAYELAYRALAQQEGSVDELRARTGVLLAAAALVASFLGTAVIDKAGLGLISTLALLAFVGSVLPSLYILWPKAKLIFAVRGTVLFEEEFGEPGGLSETHRRLAYWLESYREANQVVVERLFRAFRLATVLLVVEVVLWTLGLGGILW